MALKLADEWTLFILHISQQKSFRSEDATDKEHFKIFQKCGGGAGISINFILFNSSFL